MHVRRTRLLPVAITALVALAIAGAALADQWQIHRTAAGNAAARAAVVQRSDLGSATGWTGGAKAPDLSSTPPCGSFQPKQSDLVVTGAAATQWRHTGLEIDSQANVLSTTRMVRLDWQRSILAAGATACLRKTLSKGIAAGTTLLHFGVIAFPRLTAMTRSYRAVLSTGGIKVFVDVLVVGKGRTEIELQTIAPLSADAIVSAGERRLARALVARAHA